MCANEPRDGEWFPTTKQIYKTKNDGIGHIA